MSISQTTPSRTPHPPPHTHCLGPLVISPYTLSLPCESNELKLMPAEPRDSKKYSDTSSPALFLSDKVQHPVDERTDTPFLF